MIRARGLVKRWDQGVVVDGVDLAVEAGELLVLVGSSGSGKTTTLKMLNRLIEPTSGQVEIEGQDAAAIPPHELRRRIGYVFQKVGLFPHLSVGENVGIGLELAGWEAGKRRARIDEVLALVELDPDQLRDRRPAALSGGQQQRVGVARALAASPRLMLLDEPFGALDPLTRDRLQQSFLRIRKQMGLTAVFVTHDMAEALLLGDRIAVMDSGRILQCGPPRELLARPADPAVAALLETPRRQAARVAELLGAGSST